MTKKLYYLLSLTWGLPITLIGAVVALFLIAKRYKPKRFGWVWCFEIGERWGGLNLGIVFLCEKGASDNLKCHEFGHAIQNCRLGLTMPFFVLCSAIRYHYINHLEKEGLPVMPYDSWWFEGQATHLGTEYYNKIKEGDVS